MSIREEDIFLEKEKIVWENDRWKIVGKYPDIEVNIKDGRIIDFRLLM